MDKYMMFFNRVMLFIYAIVITATLYPLAAYATDNVVIPKSNVITVKNRPKTALVLSGGGARGAAHIGVIKVLEELKIPIDYVVGTSMGSIIGGLYSAGYSPAELEALIKNIDWDLALEDKPPRSVLSYRRKQADKDLLGIEVGFHNGKFTIPEGIRAGQELGFILKKALRRVGNTTSFNKLPISFKAIATDITNGELVALSQGDLSKTIRASMSVPGVFVPVTIDGRKLVDGGLVSNLPVQIARDMGADRIIAVDIGSGLIDETELADLLGVTMQMINVLMKQNVDNSIAALKAGDLYIRPDLGSFSSTNFKEAYTIVDNGYKAASSKRISLGNYSVSPKEYKKWKKTQRRAELKSQPKINFIEVKGNERVDERQVLARMKQQVGSTLNSNALAKDLKRVYSIGDFETVGYDLIHRDTNKTGLEIEVSEKPWGPHYLRGTVRLSDDFEGGSNFNLLLNHRFTQLNSLGGEWENTLEIGKRRSIKTEFYQPLTYAGEFFIHPQFEISEDARDVYNGKNREDEYTVNQTGVNLDLGWTPRTDTEVRLGLEYGKAKGSLRVGSNSRSLPKVEADIGAIIFSVGLDRHDSPYFPTEGSHAEIEVKIALDELGSDDKYKFATLEAGKFWSKDEHVFGINMSLASSFDGDLPLYESFTLGGLGRLSGLNEDQLSGSHLGLINGIYYRPLEKLPGNLGFSLEAGNVWQDSDDVSIKDLIYSGSIFWSYDSLAGPLYIGYGITDDADKAVHLTLGKQF